jgi:ankyrin repeat protein/CHAT domain-containing protein
MLRLKIAIITLLFCSCTIISFSQTFHYYTSVGDSSKTTDVAISPNGRYAISRNDNGFRIWDVQNKKEIKSAIAKNLLDGPTCYSITNDGKEVVAGYENGDLLYVSVNTGKITHDYNIEKGNLKLIKSKSSNGILLTGATITTMHTHSFISVDTVYQSSMHLDICYPETGKINYIDFADISSLAVSDNDSLLVACVRKGKYDDSYLLLFFDLTTGSQVYSIPDISATDLAFSHDGKLLTAIDGYGYLQIFDMKTMEKVKKSFVKVTGKLAFSSNNKEIYIVEDNGAMQVCSNYADNKINANDFFATVQSCNIPGLKMLIGKGADINMQDKYGRTALIIACQDGCMEMVKYLVTSGARSDVLAKVPKASAIMAAIENNHIDIVKYLMDNNRDDMASDGWFPLGVAAGEGNLEMVKYLLGNGIQLNSSAGENESALMIAVQTGHYDVADYLLKQGIDANYAKEFDEQKALMIAADINRPDLVQLLLDHGANPCMADDEGSTALDIARLRRYDSVTGILYRKTLERWEGDSDKYSADRLDEYFFHEGIVENIVKQNHLPADSLNNLLLIAARSAKTGTVKRLLALGANVNCSNPEGYTPLHLSILGQTHKYNRDLTLPELLIDSGADINARTIEGMTPLMFAIDHRYPDFAAMLIRRGADVTIKNNLCLNAAQVIIKKIDDEESAKRGAAIVNAMYDENAVSDYFKSQEEDKIPVEQDTKEILINLLTDKGAYKNSTDTKLVSAAAANDLSLVRKYLHEHSNLEQTDDSCRTALSYAIDNENTSMAELLIKNGAKVGVNNIAKAEKAGDIKMAQLLADACVAANKQSYDKDLKLVDYLLINNPGDYYRPVADSTTTNDSIENYINGAVTLKILTAIPAKLRGFKEIINKEMSYAVNTNQMGLLKASVTLGADVNYKYAEVLADTVRELSSFGEIDEDTTNRSSPKIPEDQVTAAYESAYRGYSDIFYFLTKHGARTDFIRDYNFSPLFANATVDLAKYLVDTLHVHLNDSAKNDYDTEYPLEKAAESGNMAVAKYLVSKGAKINPDVKKHSPVMAAFNAKQWDMVAWLLSQGALFENADRSSLLVSAVQNKDTVSIKKLIALGVDVNMPDNGVYPLVAAACDDTILQLLIANGANVNSADERGNTALIKAASCDINSVKTLIDHGASIDTPNNDGETALTESITGERDDVAELLIQSGADKSVLNKDLFGEFITHCEYGGDTSQTRIDTLLRCFMSQGIDINDTVGWNGTPLNQLVGYPLTVKMLLDAGANPNIENKYGETPIMNAVSSRNLVTIRLLLSAGAKTKIGNYDALYTAVREGSEDIAREIFVAGNYANDTFTLDTILNYVRLNRIYNHQKDSVDTVNNKVDELAKEHRYQEALIEVRNDTGDFVMLQKAADLAYSLAMCLPYRQDLKEEATFYIKKVLNDYKEYSDKYPGSIQPSKTIKLMDHLRSLYTFIPEQQRVKYHDYVYANHYQPYLYSNEISEDEQMAEQFIQRGDYQTAIPYYERALAISEKYCANDLITIRLLLDLRPIYLATSNLQKYLDIAETRQQLFTSGLGNDHYATLIAGYDKFTGLLSLGRSVEALQYGEKLYGKFKLVFGEKDYNTQEFLTALATLYGTLGMIDKSYAMWHKAYDLADSTLGKGSQPTLFALMSYANFKILDNKLDEADTLLSQGVDWCKAMYGNSETLLMLLDEESALAIAERQYPRAIELASQGLRIADSLFGQNYMNAPSLYMNRGTACFMTGNNRNACKRDINKCLAIDSAVFGKKNPNYLYALYTKAVLLDMMNENDTATSYYVKANSLAFEELEQIFPYLGEDEKRQFYGRIQVLSNSLTDFVINKNPNDSNLIGLLLQNIYKTKGLLLNNSTKLRRQILNSSNHELIDSFKQWITLREILAQAYFNGPGKNPLNNNIDSIANAATMLERELSRNETFQASQDTAHVSWHYLRKLLKADEALVEIIRFNKKNLFNTEDSVNYAAIIIKNSSKTPEIILLPHGAEMESVDYGNYISHIQRLETDEQSYNIYFKPLVSHLINIKKIFLSADGVYNSVNLNTLYNATTNSYIIDSFEIQLLTNSTDLIKAKAPARFELTNAVLFGHPNYSLPDSTHEKLVRSFYQGGKVSFVRGSMLSTQNFKDLPGTETEVRNIDSFLRENHMESTVYLSDTALEERIKSLNSPSILHIATHGFFVSSQAGNSTKGLDRGVTIKYNGSRKSVNGGTDTGPKAMLNTGLILSGATPAYIDTFPAGKMDDGILTAYEACDLNLDSTTIVVLSACETGKGSIATGEGIYGLQRGFAMAGAQSVMMSLWKVDDEATQKLMTLFYKNYLKSHDKIKALHDAQIAMKCAGDHATHPYYWGAFVMVGY